MSAVFVFVFSLSDSLDYVPKNMSEVTFAPNETVKTVQVTIVNDNTTESQEMFSGRLTSVSPIVYIGQGEADVLIVDDDSELVFPDSGTCSAYILNSIRPVVMCHVYIYHTVYTSCLVHALVILDTVRNCVPNKEPTHEGS